MALRRARWLQTGLLSTLPLLSGMCFAAASAPSYFRYERSVSVPDGASQACAVLDATVFSHSEPYLKDLRLIPNIPPRNGGEIPYVITLSEPLEQDTANAQVLNAVVRGRELDFDLKMPARPYSNVDLDLTAKDFVATAIVSGIAPDSAAPVALGEFTLFDLTSQHLGRSATLFLSESHVPMLHVKLMITPVVSEAKLSLSPRTIAGATVPPSREAQSLFATVAETRDLATTGSAIVAHFTLPQRVPVERVSIELTPGFTGNFSHLVRIEDRRARDPESATESVVGTIQRVHLTLAGHIIDQQQLSIVTTLGANLQGPADVQVLIHSGDGSSLPIAAVRLEMRERKLCFDPRLARGGATLLYGDAALAVSHEAYAPVFSAGETTAVAQLGPETLNPGYHPRTIEKLPVERRQQLLWAGMLIIISTTAMAVFVSSKQTR